MTYDYRAERKNFMERLKAWLATPEGAACKDRIDRAFALEEPQHSLAVDAAWDIAESEFERLNPEHRMTYGKPVSPVSTQAKEG